MTQNDFCYWLQGFFELTDAECLSEGQVKMIREHLQLAMKKVTKPLDKETVVDRETKYSSVADFILTTAPGAAKLC